MAKAKQNVREREPEVVSYTLELTPDEAHCLAELTNCHLAGVSGRKEPRSLICGIGDRLIEAGVGEISSELGNKRFCVDTTRAKDDILYLEKR